MTPIPGREAVARLARCTRAAVGSGLAPVGRPDHLLSLVRALRRWDRTPAAGLTAMAARYGDAAYVVDELGTLSFNDVQRRSNALANALAEAGIGEGDCVGLMCRNHRYFVETAFALSRLGVTTLLLNTDFAAPQLAGAAERERPRALICDEEFEPLLAEAAGERPRFVAWGDGDSQAQTVEELIAAGDESTPTPPSSPGRHVILTSGTTGTPKGARRSKPPGVAAALGVLERIPVRARDTVVIPAPLFHGWGFLFFNLSFVLGTTIVLRRRFEPQAAMEAIDRHRAEVAAMVPVMLQRILELPADTRDRYDTSSLRAIPLGGSAIPGDLAVRAMDRFGDVVYNTYGSTEVGFATTATPADLRAAPGTAGKPMLAIAVRILDPDGRELEAGETGRIFVGSQLAIDGYTGGGGKEVIAGAMETGDVGWLDEDARLHVSGRDDDMIVSGGENVFPREVEDLLAAHEAVADVAVVGVEDADYGQRLVAFIVRAPSAELSAEEARAHVRANLARYKVPRSFEFRDSLPRNPSGKVLKRELAQSLAKGPLERA